MKTAVAVVTAFALMAIAWFVVIMIPFLLMKVAALSGHGGGMPRVIFVPVTKCVAPVVAGYLAVTVTASLFSSVDARSLYTAFASSIATIGVFLFVVSAIAVGAGRMTWIDALQSAMQIAFVLVGAWIGRTTAISATSVRSEV